MMGGMGGGIGGMGGRGGMMGGMGGTGRTYGTMPSMMGMMMSVANDHVFLRGPADQTQLPGFCRASRFRRAGA